MAGLYCAWGQLEKLNRIRTIVCRQFRVLSLWTDKLYDENVRIMDRRRNFDAVRTSVVIFGSGKRLVRQIDLHQMDVAFRKRREIYEDCCWATLGNGLGKAMARSSSHLE